MIRLLFVLTLLLSVQAHAAVIEAEHFSANENGSFRWEQVNTDDSTEEVVLKRNCGLYEFHVEGTEATVELNLTHGKTSGALTDVNTALMPAGSKLTGSSTGNSTIVRLSGGFVDIAFTSAGTNAQDIDIWMSHIGDCD